VVVGSSLSYKHLLRFYQAFFCCHLGGKIDTANEKTLGVAPLMYTERALSCHTSNRLSIMLTNLVCSISRLGHGPWDYTTVLRLHQQCCQMVVT